MILGFDDFNNVNILQEDMDIVYLTESLSVSRESDAAMKILVTFINNQISKRSNLTVVQNYSYGDKLVADVMPGVLIFDHPCELHLDFLNLNEEQDNPKDFYRNNFFGAKIKTIKKNENGIVRLSFLLEGTLLLKNKKLDVFSKSILSHELRHAYINIKLYDGIEYLPYIRLAEHKRKWKYIYRNCEVFLNECKKKDFRKLFTKDFYKIIYSLYTCDTGEIGAFTQQAYTECCDCVSKNDIDSKLKKSILYEIKKSFEYVIEILDTSSVIEDYENNRINYEEVKNLPNIETVKKLINKRYKKIKSNYGRLWVLLVDEFNERNNIIDEDIEL